MVESKLPVKMALFDFGFEVISSQLRSSISAAYISADHINDLLKKSRLDFVLVRIQYCAIKLGKIPYQKKP